jgi:hypothetical protein
VIAGSTNEIHQYIDARYLSVAEGVDSLLLFKKHTEWSPVTRLVVHLLGQHNVILMKMKIWLLWRSVLPARKSP